jgi:hypothetical protein
LIDKVMSDHPVANDDYALLAHAVFPKSVSK